MLDADFGLGGGAGGALEVGALLGRGYCGGGRFGTVDLLLLDEGFLGGLEVFWRGLLLCLLAGF